MFYALYFKIIMDILIKSFNRAYYLDRCLCTIKQFVSGYDQIIIMDDGTPHNYLELITKKYPFVKIVYSDYYYQKSEACAHGKASQLKEIPTKLWTSTAKNASDYFVLLEEDMWFTAPVNLNVLKTPLADNNIAMLKLFWLGNPNLVQAKGYDTKEYFEIFKLQPSQKNWLLYYFKYYRFHRVKWLKKLLGLYNHQDKLSYYSVYAVAGMIFKQSYFLSVWQNNQTSVYENQQILNGLKAIKKNNFQFAKTKQEFIKTGFISSSTNDNSIKKNTFDQFAWNKFLNDCWLNNAYDVMENFPKDFSENYVLDLLKKSSFDSKNWHNWHQQFKSYYQNIGCDI